MVHLIASSGYGLTAAGNRVFTQADSSGAPATDAVEAGDMFGAAISGGKLGSDDLVVAAPREDLGSVVNAGVVHHLKQIDGKFPTIGTRVLSIADVSGSIPAAGDRFGVALASWNFGNGGRHSLLVCQAETSS